MNYRDRLINALSPTGEILADLLDEIITRINYDHNTNLDATEIAAVYARLNEFKDDLNAHMANDFITSAGATALYALLNEIQTDLNAHMQDGTAHTNDDDVTAQNNTTQASSKATAYALANSLKTTYNAHRVVLLDATEGAVHGAADATNVTEFTTLTATSTWQEIIDAANELRTDYEAHRILTTGSVHAAADSTHVISAAASSGVSTHTNDDDVTAQVAASDATTLATAIILVNAIKTAYEAHRIVEEDDAEAVVHTAADETNTATYDSLLSTATLLEVNGLMEDVITAYTAHLADTSAHANADTSNTVTSTAADVPAAYVIPGLEDR